MKSAGSPKEEIQPQRDTVFISHANPEDNQFTLWLALRLAKEGYPVWCDLTKLLGGEAFWDDIEKTIREKANKVIYVLSKASNETDGVIREIHLAQNVARKNGFRDFVIPLHIDDLPYSDVTIEVNRLNIIPFEKSWARGLERLLKKLDEDNVPKKKNFSPNAVSSWWRTQFSAEHGVIEKPDEHLSNWFPITHFPETIYFHKLTRTRIGKVEVPDKLPYPAAQDGALLISFAKAGEFDGFLGEQKIVGTRDWLLSELLNGKEHRDFKRHLSRILRVAWEQMMEKRGLPLHTMANKTKCGYFTTGKAEKDTIYFRGVDGTKSHRAVVGFKTITNLTTRQQTKRFWHYGIQGKPILYPRPMYVIKGHVLFSNGGRTIWQSKERLASARRNQCAGWWNDDWRDRMLATISWLARDEEFIQVPLAQEVALTVIKSPITFESPVTYLSPKEEQSEREDEDIPKDYEYEDEEEDFEDEDWEGGT